MRGIVSTVNYGKIRIKLKDIMEPRGINRNELAQAIGVRFEVINKWYNSESMTRIDTDILAKLCYALSCNVEDIIEYVEN